MNYLTWTLFTMMQPAEEGGQGGIFSLLLPIMFIFVLYYFLIHMPQKKKQQERQKMMDALKRGDEVITNGGIYGRVTGITEKVVTLEVAPKVKIRVARAQIAGVTSKSTEEEKGDKD